MLSAHSMFKVLFVAFALASISGCVADTDSPGSTGSVDGKADTWDTSAQSIESATLILSESGYRCPCHRDIQVRASVVESLRAQVAIGSELQALVITNQGDQAELTLQYAGNEFVHTEFLIIEPWEESGWTALYVVLTGTVGGQQVNELYGFYRESAGMTIQGLTGERINPEELDQRVQRAANEATVTEADMSNCSGRDIDFEGKVTCVTHSIGLVPLVARQGSRLNAEMLVRDPANEAFISWGNVSFEYLGYDAASADGITRARFGASNTLSQDPGDPDPTRAMIVRFEFTDMDGIPVNSALEYELVDGVPITDSVRID